MQEDKYELIREQLRKEAENNARRLEQREEELLDNVMSFSEHFDDSFYKLAKKIKYNGRSLYSLLIEDVSLNNFPIHGELKSNFDKDNLKNQILEVIKSANKDDYSQLIKYNDAIKITQSYQNAYLFAYSCRCVVTTAISHYVKSRFYDGCVSSNINLVDLDHQEIIDLPKGKLNLENIKKSNFTELVKSTYKTHPTQRTITQLYSKLKRQATKYMEQTIKTIHHETNYCLRAVDFTKICIKRILVPVYVLHCKKPGFDIKYTINANSKSCI